MLITNISGGCLTVILFVCYDSKNASSWKPAVDFAVCPFLFVC